jgi:DNA-binding response OmpR family regulator
MLTARDAAGEVVGGLDAVADDYLTKPFSFRVLLARLRAISRRSGLPPKARLEVNDLLLDPASREVSRAGVALSLTATEYRVLEFLMRRAGHAVSRSAIIEGMWDSRRRLKPIRWTPSSGICARRSTWVATVS